MSSSLSHSNSLTRIRSIQRMLSGLEIDALLCIPGADSSYNEGSRRIFNYLLFEVSGDELDQLELGATSEEEEDTFLLITSTQLSVYCHPNCYNSLISRLVRWHPSLSVLCDLSYSDREDTDHFEVFKIKSFIEMTQRVKNIGVAYGRGASVTMKSGEQGFSQMSVEQWPLIQAYALEELGGRGFFTMTHRVSDVSCAVEAVYSVVDPLSVRYLLRRGERLFSKQWDDLIESISRLDPGDVSEKSESELVAGMKTYIQHAKRQDQNPGRARGYAYVLVGQNSQKLKYKLCPVASNTVADGVSPQCVVELSDPLLPLVCARTLFFSQAHSPIPPDPTHSLPRPPNPDHEYLVRLYRLLVTEIRNGMLSLLGAANIGGVRDSVLEKIRAALDKENGRDIGVHVHISSYNLLKEERPADSEIDTRSVYYLKATLTDVMSPANPAKKLGAIVFGDSFLTSELRVESADSQLTTETLHPVAVLTESVPVFLSWADRCSQLLGGVTLKSCLQSGEESPLGNPISLGVKDILLTTDFIPGYSPPVKTYYLSKGLVLQNNECRLVWLPWDQVESIRLIEGAGSSQENRLQVSLKSSLLSHLPVFLRSGAFSLLYPPHTTEHSRLYREIVGYLRSVRPNLFSIENETNDSKARPIPTSGFHTIDKFSELREISCVYDGLISSQSLLSYLYPDNTPSVVGKVVVNVLGGLPGSNIEMLASLVIETTRGEFDWLVLREQLGCDSIFDAKRFHESFQEIVEKCLKKRDEQSEVEHRILVLAPCFSALSQVVQGILQHSATSVRETTCVGCVTLSLSLANSFTPSGELHPLVSYNLRPGVISNVILSSGPQSDQTPAATARYNQVLSLCRSVATGAGIIQTTQISSLPAEHIRSILSSDNFLKLGRVRCWFNPDLDKNSSIQSPIDVDSRTVRCCYYLSQAALNAALKTLPKEVEFVKGIVNLSSDTPQYHHVEMSHSSVQLYPVSVSSPLPNTSVIVFYGSYLQYTDFISVIQSCLDFGKRKLIFKTEQTLGKEELCEIDIRCKNVPLPEGVYFNGYQYVGFDGEKWACHPCRADIVSEYLVEVNKKIESHNKDIDKFYEEIFSY